ncbi:MAG: PQQ-dependent sugar dehydrogenase, partial [Actinomycetota bacterium]
ENGPECNDEINLVRSGDNYAWGPSESCPDTNQDGPAPRRLPKFNFSSTIGITGTTFCDGCRLGRTRDGDLFFGACCGGALQRIALNAPRTDVVGSPVSVLGNTVYSMETAPNGRIFFSDTHAIYRLVRR